MTNTDDQADNLVEVYGGKEDQSAGAPPLEVIYPGKVGIYHIKIKKQTADDGIEFKILGSDNIPNNGSNHIYGHSAYPNVVSVAAYHLENGQLQVASYSSRGPATMYSVQNSDWTTQNVPTIIATSGVQTYVGSVAKLWNGGNPLFYGTSAAAPHVAGIAALYLQACSKSNLDFIQDLKMSASTMPNTGTNGGQWNNMAGFGLANALETVNRGKGRVATPIFSPSSGAYYNSTTLSVAISCPTSGATIRYSLDPNGEVTSSSNIYTPGTYISITGSKTIKAKAFLSGMLDSFTSTAIYNVTSEAAPPSGDVALWELKPSVYKGTIKYVSEGKDYVDWDILGSERYRVGTGDFYGGTLSAEVARPFYQWYLQDNIIPDDAEITSVKLEFTLYQSPQTSNPQSINLYKVKPIDIYNAENTWKSINADLGGVLLTNSPISVSGSFLTVDITPSSPYFNTFVSELKKSLAAFNSFTLGIVSASESDLNKYFIFDVASQYSKLTITFNSPTRQLVARNQLGTNDTQYNQGEIAIDNIWQKSPFNVSSKWNTTHIVEAPQKLKDNNQNDWKFNSWGNNGPTSYNQTVKLINNATFTASYTPLFKLTVKNNLEGIGEGGLILNGRNVASGYTETDIVTGTSYNISAYEPMTGSDGEDYQFGIWSDGVTTSVHPSINMNSTMTLTACYKHSRFSSTSTAFANTNQRKFIRTPDGSLHLVYESMGYVWYERSSDGGNSWIIMNGGKPLSTYPSKSPSIDYNGYSDLGTIGIVFQEDYPGSGGMIKYFPVRYSRDNYGNINYNSYALQDIIDLGDVSFSSFDASPVIAFGSTSPFFLVVWKGLEGLTAKYFDGNNSNVIVPKSAETVLYSVSDQTSEHPFLVSNKLGNSVFHLAWDQNTSTTSGTIRYCKLSAGTTVDVVGGSYNSNVSSGCGYSKNSMPSLIPASDNTVRISWLGSEIYDMTSSVFRGMFSDGTWNPRFWSFGSNVASQCINLGSDGYYILFSDYISGAYKNQFTDSRTLSNIYTLNTTGKYVQLNNDAGGTSRTMYGMSFYTDGLPYMFDRSYYSIGHYYGLNKSVPGKEAQVSGRGAILSKEGAAKFYFKIEDISVEGKSVGFINVPDTVKINGINELNGYLVTEPFVLQDTSSYTFRTIYGVSDSLAALKTLGKDGAVSFKVELLDNSNKVLSTLKDVSFSGSIPISKKFGSYKVNLKGIGKKQVRMKLTVENNMDLDLTTLDSYFTKQAQGLSGSLAKYETINIDGKEIVTEYSLNQNYPNPFNPVTRINYQIPKSAKVTLKVYDILGKEVATLVNDYKEIGKYSVDFNASALSSGVYIYELRANDFVKSGKMMLLK